MAASGEREKTGPCDPLLPVWGNRQDAEISARKLAGLARGEGGVPPLLFQAYKALLLTTKPQYRERFLAVLGKEDPVLVSLITAGEGVTDGR